MSASISVVVIESIAELTKLRSGAAAHQRPRLKMLLLLAKGTVAVSELAAKTGVHRHTITGWKKKYNAGGLSGFLSDERGGDFTSGIDAVQKEQIRVKLSDPKNALTSFWAARQWMSDTLGIAKSYGAAYRYIVQNFKASLKAGRKSHVLKDEGAVANFKKKASNLPLKP